MGTPEYAQATFIMLYWSCHNEVHTHDLVRIALQEGKKVCLPRCDVERRQITTHQVTDLCADLEVGPYGILQPRAYTSEIAELDEMGVCVIPGIAFDREGNRRTLYSLRHSYISFRLLEGADIYQIAKNCRTSVEMIEKHYAVHLKNMIDAAAINVRKKRPKKVKPSK